MLQLTSIKCENKLLNYTAATTFYLAISNFELAAETTIIIAKEHIPTNALIITQGLESITCASEPNANLCILPCTIDTIYNEHGWIMRHVCRTYFAIYGRKDMRTLAMVVVNCKFHTGHRWTSICVGDSWFEAIYFYIAWFYVRLLRHLNGRLAAVLAIAIRETRW